MLFRSTTLRRRSRCSILSILSASVASKEPTSTHTLRLWKALLCAYNDADDMKGGAAVFEAIPTALRDVGVVHAMMEAHCNAGEYEATVALFHELRADATQRADVLMFVSLLKALTALSALSFERKIHCELRASKMARHAVTATMSSA